MNMTPNKLPDTNLVDGDLEKMTRDELITAVTMWRNLAPQISEICHELADYRQIAPNPNQLKNHIDTTMQMYRETIAKQAAQITEMQKFIEEMVDDPLQINKRLAEQAGRGKKPRLH